MKSHLENKYHEGRFADTKDYGTFARALNEEALSVCHDKHLRIRTVNAARTSNSHGHEGASIEAEMLNGGIGFIEIHSFMDPKAKELTDRAMKVVDGANALIIDIRENGGGSPEYVRYVCSYFFEGHVLLNSLYWRYRNKTDKFYTLEKVTGAKHPDIPLYVLVSGKTFSAAEEFAYNLQSRGRATIIGETTGGGAHPVNVMKVDKHIEMVLPVGRAINPVTGTNWEGVGVIPDIKTTPGKALDKALELINN
jgi:C-terminal processing protease CtpA/Prc